MLAMLTKSAWTQMRARIAEDSEGIVRPQPEGPTRVGTPERERLMTVYRAVLNWYQSRVCPSGRKLNSN